MKSLNDLAEEIKVCRRCALCNSRKNAVPGEGPADARIMMIGEAPGRNEDEKGRPFVGRAGSLLDQALQKASLSRDAVFITNIVKCRPPNNRRPRSGEVSACRDYLFEQIRIVKPNAIITLGLTALQFFEDSKSLKLTPFEWRYEDISVKVFPTYHPAAALRGNKIAKESLFNTISTVRSYIGGQLGKR
ncbi:MAG: uracil-DNA glycosylase [Conexivisphaerales archaeon]